ncbi:hypothetical protein LKI01_24130 [Companilactobacillus paralimentarius]|nr:hypothetical protein LKI01_24130 [Companilactobacillus paralimentarius]
MWFYTKKKVHNSQLLCTFVEEYELLEVLERSMMIEKNNNPYLFK